MVIRKLTTQDSQTLQSAYQVGTLRQCLHQIYSAMSVLTVASFQCIHQNGVTRIVAKCKAFSKSTIMEVVKNHLWEALFTCSKGLSMIAESTELINSLCFRWPDCQYQSGGRAHDHSQVELIIEGLFEKLPIRVTRLCKEQEWRNALSDIPGASFNGLNITSKSTDIERERPSVLDKKVVHVHHVDAELKMPPPASKIILRAKRTRFSKGNDKRLTVQLRPSDISTMQLIGQFNREFLICMVPEKQVVCLLDQHAIHERIRLERFVSMGRDFVASQEEACRGAIKFGKSLTTEQMLALLNDLASCQHPFICAHGRPSTHPIASFLQ